MINSHLLYRLSYRGTTVRILLFAKEKSTPATVGVSLRPGPETALGRGKSEHLNDGVSDVTDFVAVLCCSADPTGVNRLNAELDAQSLDLLRREAGVGEHAALGCDEAEIRLRALGRQLLDHAQT